jgi:hypothetical protein
MNGVHLTEAQYQDVIITLHEIRERGASLGDRGSDIAAWADDIIATLGQEHYTEPPERDHCWDANYKPGHSSDFPF